MELKGIDANNYTADQYEQIELGYEHGVNISFYTNPSFMALQMEQIRLGLEAELNVRLYAKLDYDWCQMEEIRLGLLNGVSVDLYLSPNNSYRVMHEIRRGLEMGVNFTSYLKKYEPGIIKQIRKASVDGVDITPYLTQDYNEEQLEEIRHALRDDLPIDAFLDRDLRGPAIEQIAIGLRNGIDVSRYSDPGYSWRQMREIRLGLESRLDISKYSSKMYAYNQMAEIREGLTFGLDVSSYASLMYTAKEMQLIREKLLADILNPEGVKTTLGEESFEGIDISMSEDEMEAYIIIDQGRPINRDELYEAIREACVLHGVDDAKVAELSQSGLGDGQLHVLARGTKPKHGRDGYYDFYFNVTPSREPIELEDGTLDYQNVNWYESVKEGAEIARYYPATDGTVGYTVTGRCLETLRGHEQKVIVGKGFHKLEDDEVYVSDHTGIIEYDEVGNKITITECLEVDKVTRATGNITYEGSVHVLGDITSGAVINAGESIIVDGFVEDCNIVAGGDIILKKGVNGVGGRGLVKAGGDIVGKFFENANLESDGGISGNYCLHCNILCHGVLDLSGRQGALVGGKATVEEKALVYNLGNDVATPTEIIVGVNDGIRQVQKDIELQAKQIKKELMILNNSLAEFKIKFKPEDRNDMPIFIQIENAIYTKELELKKLDVQKTRVNNRIRILQRAYIDVRNHLYHGSLINISGTKWKAEDYYNVTVTNKTGRIVVTKG